MKSLKSILQTTTGMGIIIILLLITLPVSTALADTAGPNNPGLGSNVTDIGTEAWQNPGNITTPDSPYATVTLYHGHRFSNYLEGTQYGFIIPADAAILGIEVKINRMFSGHPNAYDNMVSMVKGGAIVGDNKAITTAAWPTILTVATYGGASDLWGTTWSSADINSPDFGVALAANRDNNGNPTTDASVDTMQITIYYEYSTTTSVECGDGSPVIYGDSIMCVATVTRSTSDQTPRGTVSWTTAGSGSFVPNPCTLAGENGVATCTATYTPTAVGSGTHLLTASYAGDTFFAPSSASQSVDVVQRPITVTADPQTKVFGDPDPLFTYQITEGSLVFNDTFTGTLTRESGEAVGQYAILQGSLALPIDYNLNYVSDYLTITQANPTCSVNGWTGVYDGNPHGATGTCSGVYGETLEGLDLGASFTDFPGGTASWVFTDITGNYNDANGNVEIMISKTDPTCSVDGYTGVFDGNPHGASGLCSGVNDESLEGLDLGATFTDVPGGTAHWVFTDVTGNYNNASGSEEILISKAEAMCDISGYTDVYDTAYHGATGTCSGIGGENPGTLNLGETFKDVPGGTAHWSLTGNGNYNDQTDDASIVISKAEAMCDISGYTDVYDAAYHGANGTCSGIGGENPGTLDLGATFKDVPGGTVHWSFTGNGNYNDQSGDASIVISKAEAVCVVNPYVVEYDRLAHTATGNCTGVVGEELIGLDLTGTTHTEIAGYSDDHWTFVDVSGNYNDTNGSVNDEITLRAVTIVADAKSKAYGQVDPELTYQITAGFLLSGDAFSGGLIRQPGESAGTYAILQGTLSLSDYYVITYVGANFTITGVRYFYPMLLNLSGLH